MISEILRLSSGIPALLKAICSWWLDVGRSMNLVQWQYALIQQPTIRYRLEEVFDGLSQEEHLTLSEWQRMFAASQFLPERTAAEQRAEEGALAHYEQANLFLLNRLREKGIFVRETAVFTLGSTLLASFLDETEGRGLGKIWMNEQTGDIYQGQRRIEKLTPLEKGVLHYMLKFPRAQHTKTDLMANAWPEDVVKEEITDGSLYRIISSVRKKEI